MKSNLQEIVTTFAKDSENPETNYACAQAYEELGQTSAAIGWYLRTAERTNDNNLAYECLCRIGLCFEKQTKRGNTVRVFYKHALLLLPNRPEAYYLLARFYERSGDHVSGYMYAELGLKNADFNQAPLRNSVEYLGKYVLVFQKMVSSWWWGKVEETRALMVQLRDEYKYVMDENHRQAVQRNLNNLGVTGDSHVLRPYHIWQSSQLRYKFKDYDKVVRNFSQVYQDLFTLSMLDGKKKGTYLEIGTAGPEYGNNTKLLEEMGWTGVGIEWDAGLAKAYAADRKNPVRNEDALKVNYVKLLGEIAPVGTTIDYLQLDCEPASTTYDIMTKIPFNLYKFAVITYEHDDYVDMTGQYRQKSREFLSSRGYELVVSDISPDGVSNFEDWWVHPDLVSRDIINVMKDTNKGTKHATDYMLREPLVEIKPEDELNLVDYGTLSNQFARCINREIVSEKIYERFFPVDSGSVIVDIGANIGLFPWTLKKRTMKHVYAIEPSATLIPALTNNLNKLPFPSTVLNYGIGATSGVHHLDQNDWLAGEVDQNSSFVMKTFKDFLSENNIDHINFFKIDCEGGEYSVFNEENYEFLTTKVDKIVGEWHLSYMENGVEAFIKFKNLYLKGKTNFRVFQPYDWKEVTHKICDDNYIHEFYNWWNPRNKGAQLIVYIDNTTGV